MERNVLLNSSRAFGVPTSTAYAPSSTSRTLGVLGIVLGVVTIGIALGVLLWPKATLLVVAVMFGVYVLLCGIRRVILALIAHDVEGWLRGVSVLSGGLMVIAGMICVRNPFTSLIAVAVIVSIGWFVDGIVDIAAGVVGPHAGPRWLLIASGSISVIGAGALLFWPGLVLVTLTTVGGWLLLVIGAARVVLGIQLVAHSRSETGRAMPGEAP